MSGFRMALDLDSRVAMEKKNGQDLLSLPTGQISFRQPLVLSTKKQNRYRIKKEMRRKCNFLYKKFVREESAVILQYSYIITDQ